MNTPRATADKHRETAAGFAMLELDGIESWPALDDPATWLYIAGPLGPQVDASGAPDAALFSLGDAGVFQCGVKWEADSAALERLRQEAAGRTGLQTLRPIPAPVQLKAARLTLTSPDAGGVETVLQETSASGYPPFTALFHVSLDVAQRSLVEKALSGTPGILAIEYAIRIERRARATARVSGAFDATEGTSGTARSLIDAALVAGRLALAETVEGPASDALRADARNGALDRAAAVLDAALPAGKSAANPLPIDVSVSLAGVVADETTRCTDVASWWKDGHRPRIAGVALAATGLATRRETPSNDVPVTGPVSVEREISRAPVAFIEVRGGSSTVLLRGPDFLAARLSAPAGSTLQITVHFTDGGPAYTAEAPWPGGAGCVLGTAALGLAAISLDGSARKATGARSLAATTAYAPSGAGTANVHETRLRYGEWSDAWFVVTREQGLGGEITVEWSETAADGTQTTHPPQSGREQNIAL